MKKLNSNDIAKLAGVSRSTVSRVINDYANVPAETRQRVMKVIKENHYYPQLSGQLLNGMPSRTIGLFWLSTPAAPKDSPCNNYFLNITDITRDSLSSDFFLNIVDAAASRDYLVLSCMVENLSDKKNVNSVRKIFMEGRIDGGIFIGVDNGEPLIEELVGLGKVVGLFDYYCENDAKPNRITVNFEKNTGRRAVDYLYEMGHRNIAIIDGDMRRLSSIHRHEGYMSGMLYHHLPLRNEWLAYGGITQDSGYAAACRLLDDCNGYYPTAICANNDAVAFGVYQACAERGLRIPEDISVIGVDGHAKGEVSQPPLTTFRFDFHRMFHSLVDRVIDTVEQTPQDLLDEFCEGELIERASVKCLLP